jgi:16S rRNA (guanine966-N2)-methyltransferase
MRIIAGEWGGRTISAPKGREVRPTSDRAREAWMSIVHPVLPGARVLDLFAGTGALGLESLSRGAAWADFVELSPRTIRTLEENVAKLGAGPRCAVHRGDAVAFAAKVARGGAGKPAYDVAFADPPYHENLAEAVAALWLAAPFATIFGVEHESTTQLPAGGDTRRYGDTAITIYRMGRGMSSG